MVKSSCVPKDTSKLDHHRIFLEWYWKEGNKFLKKIITGHEIWCYYYTPTSKQAPLTGWKHKGSSQMTKVCMKTSIDKVIMTPFFNAEGLFSLNFFRTDHVWMLINMFTPWCLYKKVLKIAIQVNYQKHLYFCNDNVQLHSASLSHWSHSNGMFCRIHLTVLT